MSQLFGCKPLNAQAIGEGAIALLKEKHHDIPRVRILGDGPERENLSLFCHSPDSDGLNKLVKKC